MLNTIFSRQTEGSDLQNLVSQLKSANDKMLTRAKNANSLSDTLYSLVQSEAPSFLIYFERIRDIYKRLSDVYQTTANDQARALDDLNDIAVRYPIFQKLSNEKDLLKKHYTEVDQKYHNAKLQLKAQETQTNLSIYRDARIERAQIAANLIDVSENFIEYRKRYHKFVANRSQNAWIRYGESIEKCAKDEAQLMSELSAICIAIRDNVNEPKHIFDVLASTSNYLNERNIDDSVISFD